jgi:hypothetical protein
MSESVLRDLFDRWERVWHEGQHDLVPSCVAEDYIRHDENGDRTVTRDAYAAELAAIHKARPGQARHTCRRVRPFVCRRPTLVPLCIQVARSKNRRAAQSGRYAVLPN